MQELGQPGNRIARLNGTMHDPMSYQDTRRAPEAARSLAFSIYAYEPFHTQGSRISPSPDPVQLDTHNLPSGAFVSLGFSLCPL
jgi:hypothetical protein